MHCRYGYLYVVVVLFCFFFFFKQKTAYEMRISDWSSDVCSSDLVAGRHVVMERPAGAGQMPDFLGDAVHVDSQADPAIADQCEPEFPLFHGVESCRGRWTCRGCVSVPGKSGPAKADRKRTRLHYSH